MTHTMNAHSSKSNSSTFRRCLLSIPILLPVVFSSFAAAQGLTPRAYVVTPIHSNAVVFTYSFDGGDIALSPTLPITGASGRINIPVVSAFHTFNFLGRSANATLFIPYAVGHFQGTVNGVPQQVYRSGLLDPGFRLSVNLKGGPAMDLSQFMKWKQKTLIGASLTVTAPFSQYDPKVLVNTGTNRWAIKPEVGLSHRHGRWLLDGYLGVWFFTENDDFFSNGTSAHTANTRSQNPLGALEGHLSYDIRNRLWVSADGNYWYGGAVSLNGVRSAGTLQANSRIGATASFPVSKHQSLKVSYSYGAIVRVGGNYHDVSLAWQYSWFGRPN